MRKEILTKEQINLLPLLKSFAPDFGLVGGTAIALNLGHRRSIDFDLFTHKKFDNAKIRKKILRQTTIDDVLIDEGGEYTVMASGVRLTFFHYPFKINFSKKLVGVIKLPDLLTLAAMKAHALGRRAKWKDYIDLYFIMAGRYPVGKITARAKQIFAAEFNEKMFRTQLAYFKDIDYTEKIIYLKSFAVPDETVKKKLIEFSLG